MRSFKEQREKDLKVIARLRKKRLMRKAFERKIKSLEAENEELHSENSELKKKNFELEMYIKNLMSLLRGREEELSREKAFRGDR